MGMKRVLVIAILFGLLTGAAYAVDAANPETYIHPDLPPFLIQHGSADATVPVQQSVELAQKIQAVCGDERVTLEVLEGFGHGDSRFDSPVNVIRVFDFIDHHLKES